jgi:hypothetical protein
MTSLLFIPGMYYTHPEITPHNRQGEFRFNKSGERVTRFASKEAEVRALIEGKSVQTILW